MSIGQNQSKLVHFRSFIERGPSNATMGAKILLVDSLIFIQSEGCGHLFHMSNISFSYGHFRMESVPDPFYPVAKTWQWIVFPYYANE